MIKPIDAHTIFYWHWDDAPEELRALSNHGGGEYFVALIPADYKHYISWLENGYCTISRHEYFTGTVYIGSYA